VSMDSTPGVASRGTQVSRHACLRAMPARLLVVEDDLDLSIVFARVARSVLPGVLIDWTVEYEEALGFLRQNQYDAVIADYLLRGMYSGLALYPHCLIRQPRAAFAVMSAYPMTNVLATRGPRRCPFLRKPFTIAECRDFLTRMLVN